MLIFVVGFVIYYTKERVLSETKIDMIILLLLSMSLSPS